MNFKTALDVGSNYGHFIKFLNDEGINAHGIESEKDLIENGVSKKVEWGYFDMSYSTAQKFDLVSLTQMITYVRDNYAFLKFVKNLLTQNGIIFISTINPESPYIRGRVTPQGSNLILSKQNYESMESVLNLKLIDYVTFRTDYYFDLWKSKRKRLTELKYYCGLKKAYVEDPNGNHAFLILKPSD